MNLIRLLKKDLAKEVLTWVERDLVSVEQARSICALYGADYDTIQGRSSGVRILTVLGFLFIGLALITIIAANWDAIPRGVRLGGLVLLTGATHVLALRHHLAGRVSAAIGLFALSNLLYGASIILVAQIYHLGEHMPDGVFWWALGTVPFAVLLRSPVLAIMSGSLSLVWLAIEYRAEFLGATFFVGAFPIFLAIELYVLIRGRASIALFLMFLASLVVYVAVALAVAWTDGRGQPEASAEHMLVGAALLVLGHAAAGWLLERDEAKAKDFGAVLSAWTLRLALVGMLILSFEEPWSGLLEAHWDQQPTMWPVLVGLMAAALWLAARTGKLPGLLLMVAVTGGVMIAVVLTGTLVNGSETEHYAASLQVLDNIALVATGAWLIVQGTTVGSSHYFFLGIAVILLTALMRYLDLIGDYIGGAVLFLAFAAVLLGAARYWRNRQDTGEVRP